MGWRMAALVLERLWQRDHRHHPRADRRDRGRAALADCLDTSQFDLPRDQLTLRYWPNPALEFTARGKHPILVHERQLRLARSAWAHHEAKRIVDDHGVEIIAAIVARARALESVKADHMLGIITEVTGDPMTARMRAYQSFRTREDGMRQYALATRGARERADLAGEFIAFSRTAELYYHETYDMRLPFRAAELLAEMGHLEHGIGLAQRQIEVVPRTETDVHKFIVLLAISHRRPALAEASAEYLLSASEDFPAARIVVAHQLFEAGRIDDARAVAAEVLGGSGTIAPAGRTLLEAILDAPAPPRRPTPERSHAP